MRNLFRRATVLGLFALGGIASAAVGMPKGTGGSWIVGNDLVVMGTPADDAIDVLIEADAVAIVREGVASERYEAAAFEGVRLVEVFALEGNDTLRAIVAPGVVPRWTVLLRGMDGDDVLLGSDLADQFYGLDGNDVILAGGGDDVVFAGTGNDRVSGGPGNDQLFGGTGDDLIDGGLGNDLIDGGSGDDRLLGRSDHDVLVGGPGRDQLNGGGGNDRLVARDGISDRVTGGPGTDVVLADRRDVIRGVEVRL